MEEPRGPDPSHALGILVLDTESFSLEKINSLTPLEGTPGAALSAESWVDTRAENWVCPQNFI